MFHTVNFARNFSTPLSCCALSNDGQTIACGFKNGQVVLLKQGQAPLALGVANNVAVIACAFSSDRSTLAAISGNNLLLYDAESDNCKLRQQLFQTPSAVCFNSDNKMLVLGYSTGHITVWDISKISNSTMTLLHEWQAQSALVNACACNDTSNKLAVVSSMSPGASMLNLRNIAGRVTGIYNIVTKVLACAFDSDGETILLANGASLSKLHWKTGLSPSYFSYSADLFNPAFVAFSPDGKRILFVKQGVAGYNFTIIATDSLLHNPVAAPPHTPPEPTPTDRTKLLPSSSKQSRGFFSCFTDCFR